MNKILIIEDEQAIRESMCEFLEMSDFDVQCAQNGKVGIQKALEIHPDLVICDVRMPEFNGWQTLSVFKDTMELRCIPFVFLTAMTTMDDLRKGMNLGADDYLTKPFDPNELLGIITRQLKKLDIAKVKEAEKRILKIKTAVNKIVLREKEENADFHKSLEHAKKVQNVILPNVEKMSNLFLNYFSFYLPKDTISGDFFWMREVNGITLVAVVDCTGHGVPAALLTMICYTQLNLCVDKYGLRKPGEILLKTNELIIEFMKSNENTQMKEGMDIALCSIDPDYNIIRFAGAKRPLYIVTNELETINVNKDRISSISNKKNQLLFEIKGDRSSIGSCDTNFHIEEQVLEYKNNDTIYLSSDGIINQFGGVNIERFKSKNFKNLLLSIQEEDLDIQKDIIQNTISSWQGVGEQTDDVAIVGIKL